MELFLVRHGLTDWNLQTKVQGRKDIELNAGGIKQAKLLSEKLKNIHFDFVFSSPLKRAFKTAQIVCSNKNVEIQKIELLTEIDFGKMEGLKKEEWENQDSPQKYFFSNPQKYIPAENGETFDELCNRTKKFVIEFIEPYKNSDKKILIVSHGAALSSLTCYLENREIKDFWCNGLKGNCEEVIYTYKNQHWLIYDKN